MQPLVGLVDTFHPMTVHFPIALILVSTLFAIVYWFRTHDIKMNGCIKTLVILATLSAWAAVITGNYHAALTPEAEAVKSVHHTFAMLTSWVVTIPAAFYLLTFFSKKEWPNWVWGLAFFVLLCSAALIAVTGYFGGYIVYNVLL